LFEQLREQYFEFGRACFSQPFQAQQCVPTWEPASADACFADACTFAFAGLAAEAAEVLEPADAERAWALAPGRPSDDV
jgi:hypothetical protein